MACGGAPAENSRSEKLQRERGCRTAELEFPTAVLILIPIQRDTEIRGKGTKPLLVVTCLWNYSDRVGGGSCLEAAVEAAEARHHEQVELPARSWRSQQKGAGRWAPRWRAGLACWAGVLGWALRAGRCGGYGRRTYGFFSSLLHQFHAEVRRPSMQLPAS